ncbi:hypothetical protein [Pleomorphomonas koreensis]|uniref:hypothetical protein n=1 Tax=Pleomorphomonas koreensis TaxID=257440 RepID=UPI000411713D|nr:hypothetical protein [Pleomorphomonas koreensis]
MEERPKYIIIHQSVKQSWLKDLGSVVTLAGLIGLGWAIGSTAMQYVGAAIAMLTLFARQKNAATTAISIGEARAILDKLEAEDGKED